MKITAIMATCGRHRCAERCLSFFLNQTYTDKHLLIYQNSEVPQQLDKSVDISRVTLVNQSIDSKTGERYKTLGAIYNDAIKHVPQDTDLICFMDDDDIFLTNHFAEGVAGYLRAKELDSKYKAYKPEKSYNRYMDDPISLTINTMEPSIFTSVDHIFKYKFSETTTEQHLQWVQPLRENGELFVDPTGKPTMIYNWGDNFPTFKTSGDYGNPRNFDNYRDFSQEHGDNILTPHDVSFYYTLV